jgi:hypothetical protein
VLAASYPKSDKVHYIPKGDDSKGGKGGGDSKGGDSKGGKGGGDSKGQHIPKGTGGGDSPGQYIPKGKGGVTFTPDSEVATDSCAASSSDPTKVTFAWDAKVATDSPAGSSSNPPEATSVVTRVTFASDPKEDPASNTEGQKEEGGPKPGTAQHWLPPEEEDPEENLESSTEGREEVRAARRAVRRILSWGQPRILRAFVQLSRR